MSEQLLHALSTVGTMRLDNFYNAFRVLCPMPTAQEGDDITNARRRIIRFLGSLGHCEFDFEKQRVYVCRSTLVSLPGHGLTRAVLTGARTPALVNTMRTYVNDNEDEVSMSETLQAVHSSFHSHGVAPDLELPMSIVYGSSEVDTLERLAETAGVSPRLGTPAAWSLVTFSAPLVEIKDSLNVERFRDLRGRWTRRVFSPGALKFSRAPDKLPSTALIEYTNPRNNQKRHVLKEGDRAAVVADPDWGRYLALAEDELQILFYEDRSELLVVPANVPLPRLLARAATLCSGFAPRQEPLAHASDVGLPGDTYVEVYRDVPYEIARRLAEKVSQSLTRLDEQHLEVAN